MKETFFRSTTITALISLILSTSAFALDHNSKEVIELNNMGVKYLERREFDQAIAYLRKAAEMDPSYQLARSNLAIAINNKGLDVYEKGSAEGGLHLMETSYFNDPTNKTTRHNLEGVIRVLKLNPDSPIDRCGLSGKAVLRGDATAAWIELCAAYEKLHNIFFLQNPYNMNQKSHCHTMRSRNSSTKNISNFSINEFKTTGNLPKKISLTLKRS